MLSSNHTSSTFIWDMTLLGLPRPQIGGREEVMVFYEPVNQWDEAELKVGYECSTYITSERWSDRSLRKKIQGFKWINICNTK